MVLERSVNNLEKSGALNFDHVSVSFKWVIVNVIRIEKENKSYLIISDLQKRQFHT